LKTSRLKILKTKNSRSNHRNTNAKLRERKRENWREKGEWKERACREGNGEVRKLDEREEMESDPNPKNNWNCEKKSKPHASARSVRRFENRWSLGSGFKPGSWHRAGLRLGSG
jgi:hypothetical protein